MINRRRPTDLEVARAIHYNETLRTPEPAELEHSEVLALFSDEPQDIVVTEDMYAPPAYRWSATVGDYDLGATVGTGRTPLDAIVELLDLIDA